ncbi:MAG: hypothetical protein KatS3mg022_0831 [Armatimonadota bacterium]|nr:MAG: hypothetical protein KatS3mg022_0831 [Armatimonadota bacterium]
MQGTEVGILPLLFNHPAGDRLREEVRSLQVGADELLEALLAGFQNIRPHLWRNACVVHQHVQPPKTFTHRLHQLAALFGLGDVRLKILDGHAQRAQLLQYIVHRPGRAHAVQRKCVSFLRQTPCDAQPNASRAACDQCDWMHGYWIATTVHNPAL